MSFVIRGLDPQPFEALFGLDDSTLEARGSRRVRADSHPGYPCRATLEDADEGESLILLAHAHMPIASSPYRASGPIFIREGARRPVEVRGALPPYLTTRLLSLRAYDGGGMMVDADVVDGAAAVPLIERLFADASVDFIHAHFARRGCYGARIERG